MWQYFLLLGMAILAIVLVIIAAFYLYSLLRARLVPYVKSRPAAFSEVVQRLQLRAGQVFVELGSGDGDLLSRVAAQYPDADVRGYEVAWYPYLLALRRRRAEGGKYRILRQDYFRHSIADADVVYIYMMPHMMLRTWEKVRSECKPGTRVFSYAFRILGEEPVSVTEFADEIKSKLYEYRVGDKNIT